MRFVFYDQTKPWRDVGVGYTQEMWASVAAACGGVSTPLAEQASGHVIPDDVIPVFLLLNSPAALDLFRQCRANGRPFVLIDHPHAGEQRHKMVRIAVNGIYSPYKEGVPIWPGRSYDWNLQPWRTGLPRRILHCPSAADFYGQWLGRDQTTGIAEFEAILHHLKLMGAVDEDWQAVLRTRFENDWAAAHQGARPGAEQAIMACGAVADGNSEILFKALRLGTPAFVWEHPDKPLANPLVNYAPLTLDRLSWPDAWQIGREPFFEQLAMSQCTLEELADPAIFARLVDWQLTHLFG